MRTFYLMAISLVFVTTIVAQEPALNASKLLTQMAPSVYRNSTEIIQLQDSTISSNYVTDHWEFYTREDVIDRYWDGRVMNGMSQEFNTVTSQWEKRVHSFVNYLGPNETDLDVYFAKAYNSFILDWRSDTLYHYDRMANPSAQFGAMMYENTIIDMEYDYVTNSFLGGSKVLITTKDDSLYDNTIRYTFDDMSQAWELTSKVEYQYDANNYQQIKKEYNWDSGTSSYVNNDQDYYVYSDGLLMQQIDQNWSGTAWVNSDKDEYTFDSNRNNTAHYDYNWDGVNSLWENNDRFLYTFSGNYMIERTYDIWNTATSIWDGYNRTSYTYNIAGQLVTEKYESCSGGIYTNNYRNTYTYDSNGNRTLALVEDWIGATSSWENSSRRVYIYNSNDDNTKNTLQDWNGSAWDNVSQNEYFFDANFNRLLELRSAWNTTTFVWDSVYKKEYFWSDFDANALPSFALSGMQVFPNPTLGEFTLQANGTDIAKVVIYDPSGKVIQEKTGPDADGSYNLRSFGSGIFLIHVTTTDNKTYTQKVIVE